MDPKKVVLAVMMTMAAVGVTAAGVWVHRHWAWLEEHHLAGLAALQILFLAVSVVFAAVTLRDEWSDLTPGEVAKGYSLALALMGTASFAVGVALLALGWLSTLGATLLHFLFMRHPFVSLGVVAAVYGVAYRWSRSSPGARRYVLERLGMRRRPSELIESHSNRHGPTDSSSE